MTTFLLKAFTLIAHLGEQFFARYGTLCGFILVAEIIDVVTAVLAKVTLGDNSVQLRKYWKYATNYVVLLLGFFLNYLQAYLMQITDTSAEMFEPIPFVSLFGIYILATILLSTTANIKKCGVPLPIALDKFIDMITQKVNHTNNNS